MIPKKFSMKYFFKRLIDSYEIKDIFKLMDCLCGNSAFFKNDKYYCELCLPKNESFETICGICCKYITKIGYYEIDDEYDFEIKVCCEQCSKDLSEWKEIKNEQILFEIECRIHDRCTSERTFKSPTIYFGVNSNTQNMFVNLQSPFLRKMRDESLNYREFLEKRCSLFETESLYVDVHYKELLNQTNSSNKFVVATTSLESAIETAKNGDGDGYVYVLKFTSEDLFRKMLEKRIIPGSLLIKRKYTLKSEYMEKWFFSLEIPHYLLCGEPIKINEGLNFTDYKEIVFDILSNWVPNSQKEKENFLYTPKTDGFVLCYSNDVQYVLESKYTNMVLYIYSQYISSPKECEKVKNLFSSRKFSSYLNKNDIRVTNILKKEICWPNKWFMKIEFGVNEYSHLHVAGLISKFIVDEMEG